MKCLTPFAKRMGTQNDYQLIDLPCGKCVPCLKGRTSAWSIRLTQHQKTATTAYFVTLTYQPETVPITKTGFMTLEHRDVQLYLKRLRKAHDKLKELPGWQPIKYFAVGEYGSKSKRPHYHLILFNAYKHLIESEWKAGYTYLGTVTKGSVGYTLKYISKSKQVPAHPRDDRQRERCTMSKGLGLDYLTQEMIAWHHADLTERVYYADENKKLALPRYYKKRIYDGLQWREIVKKYESLQIEKEAQEALLTPQERMNIVQNHIAQYNNHKLNATKNEKI